MIYMYGTCMQCIMNAINRLRFVQAKNKWFKMEWHMTQQTEQCNMQIKLNSVLCKWRPQRFTCVAIQDFWHLRFSLLKPLYLLINNLDHTRTWLTIVIWRFKLLQINKGSMARGFTWTGIEGYGLWCLTTLSTIFQLCHGGQFYWWRKLEKKQTCRKSLINFITVLSIPHHEQDSNSQL